MIAAAALLCFLWYFTTPYRLFWKFDHIERGARKVTTAAELQSWATNLLAQYPTQCSLGVSSLGTNFPKQLKGLYRHNPAIYLHEEPTNDPAFVKLVWGGGLIGHCGFDIGDTNFVSYVSHAHAWAPGVYFWSEHPQQ